MNTPVRMFPLKKLSGALKRPTKALQAIAGPKWNGFASLPERTEENCAGNPNSQVEVAEDDAKAAAPSCLGSGFRELPLTDSPSDFRVHSSPSATEPALKIVKNVERLEEIEEGDEKPCVINIFLDPKMNGAAGGGDVFARFLREALKKGDLNEPFSRKIEAFLEKYGVDLEAAHDGCDSGEKGIVHYAPAYRRAELEEAASEEAKPPPQTSESPNANYDAENASTFSRLWSYFFYPLTDRPRKFDELSIEEMEALRRFRIRKQKAREESFASSEAEVRRRRDFKRYQYRGPPKRNVRGDFGKRDYSTCRPHCARFDSGKADHTGGYNYKERLVRYRKGVDPEGYDRHRDPDNVFPIETNPLIRNHTWQQEDQRAYAKLEELKRFLEADDVPKRPKRAFEPDPRGPRPIKMVRPASPQRTSETTNQRICKLVNGKYEPIGALQKDAPRAEPPRSPAVSPSPLCPSRTDGGEAPPLKFVEVSDFRIKGSDKQMKSQTRPCTTPRKSKLKPRCAPISKHQTSTEESNDAQEETSEDNNLEAASKPDEEESRDNVKKALSSNLLTSQFRKDIAKGSKPISPLHLLRVRTASKPDEEELCEEPLLKRLKSRGFKLDETKYEESPAKTVPFSDFKISKFKEEDVYRRSKGSLIFKHLRKEDSSPQRFNEDTSPRSKSELRTSKLKEGAYRRSNAASSPLYENHGHDNLQNIPPRKKLKLQTSKLDEKETCGSSPHKENLSSSKLGIRTPNLKEGAYKRLKVVSSPLYESSSNDNLQNILPSSKFKSRASKLDEVQKLNLRASKLNEEKTQKSQNSQFGTEETHVGKKLNPQTSKLDEEEHHEEKKLDLQTSKLDEEETPRNEKVPSSKLEIQTPKLKQGAYKMLNVSSPHWETNRDTNLQNKVSNKKLKSQISQPEEEMKLEPQASKVDQETRLNSQSSKLNEEKTYEEKQSSKFNEEETCKEKELKPQASKVYEEEAYEEKKLNIQASKAEEEETELSSHNEKVSSSKLKIRPSKFTEGAYKRPNISSPLYEADGESNLQNIPSRKKSKSQNSKLDEKTKLNSQTSKLDEEETYEMKELIPQASKLGEASKFNEEKTYEETKLMPQVSKLDENKKFNSQASKLDEEETYGKKELIPQVSKLGEASKFNEEKTYEERKLIPQISKLGEEKELNLQASNHTEEKKLNNQASKFNEETTYEETEFMPQVSKPGEEKTYEEKELNSQTSKLDEKETYGKKELIPQASKLDEASKFNEEKIIEETKLMPQVSKLGEEKKLSLQASKYTEEKKLNNQASKFNEETTYEEMELMSQASKFGEEKELNLQASKHTKEKKLNNQASKFNEETTYEETELMPQASKPGEEKELNSQASKLNEEKTYEDKELKPQASKLEQEESYEREAYEGKKLNFKASKLDEEKMQEEFSPHSENIVETPKLKKGAYNTSNVVSSPLYKTNEYSNLQNIPSGKKLKPQVSKLEEEKKLNPQASKFNEVKISEENELKPQAQLDEEETYEEKKLNLRPSKLDEEKKLKSQVSKFDEDETYEEKELKPQGSKLDEEEAREESSPHNEKVPSWNKPKEGYNRLNAVSSSLCETNNDSNLQNILSSKRSKPQACKPEEKKKLNPQAFKFDEEKELGLDKEKKLDLQASKLHKEETNKESSPRNERMSNSKFGIQAPKLKEEACRRLYNSSPPYEKNKDNNFQTTLSSKKLKSQASKLEEENKLKFQISKLDQEGTYEKNQASKVVEEKLSPQACKFDEEKTHEEFLPHNEKLPSSKLKIAAPKPKEEAYRRLNVASSPLNEANRDTNLQNIAVSKKLKVQDSKLGEEKKLNPQASKFDKEGTHKESSPRNEKMFGLKLGIQTPKLKEETYKWLNISSSHYEANTDSNLQNVLSNKELKSQLSKLEEKNLKFQASKFDQKGTYEEKKLNPQASKLGGEKLNPQASQLDKKETYEEKKLNPQVFKLDEEKKLSPQASKPDKEEVHGESPPYNEKISSTKLGIQASKLKEEPYKRLNVSSPHYETNKDSNLQNTVSSKKLKSQASKLVKDKTSDEKKLNPQASKLGEKEMHEESLFHNEALFHNEEMSSSKMSIPAPKLKEGTYKNLNISSPHYEKNKESNLQNTLLSNKVKSQAFKPKEGETCEEKELNPEASKLDEEEIYEEHLFYNEVWHYNEEEPTPKFKEGTYTRLNMSSPLYETNEGSSLQNILPDKQLGEEKRFEGFSTRNEEGSSLISSKFQEEAYKELKVNSKEICKDSKLDKNESLLHAHNKEMSSKSNSNFQVSKRKEEGYKRSNSSPPYNINDGDSLEVYKKGDTEDTLSNNRSESQDLRHNKEFSSYNEEVEIEEPNKGLNADSKFYEEESDTKVPACIELKFHSSYIENGEILLSQADIEGVPMDKQEEILKGTSNDTLSNVQLEFENSKFEGLQNAKLELDGFEGEEINESKAASTTRLSSKPNEEDSYGKSSFPVHTKNIVKNKKLKSLNLKETHKNTLAPLESSRDDSKNKSNEENSLTKNTVISEKLKPQNSSFQSSSNFELRGSKLKGEVYEGLLPSTLKSHVKSTSSIVLIPNHKSHKSPQAYNKEESPSSLKLKKADCKRLEVISANPQKLGENNVSVCFGDASKFNEDTSLGAYNKGILNSELEVRKSEEQVYKETQKKSHTESVSSIVLTPNYEQKIKTQALKSHNEEGPPCLKLDPQISKFKKVDCKQLKVISVNPNKFGENNNVSACFEDASKYNKKVSPQTYSEGIVNSNFEVHKFEGQIYKGPQKKSPTSREEKGSSSHLRIEKESPSLQLDPQISKLNKVNSKKLNVRCLENEEVTYEETSPQGYSKRIVNLKLEVQASKPKEVYEEKFNEKCSSRSLTKGATSKKLKFQASELDGEETYEGDDKEALPSLKLLASKKLNVISAPPRKTAGSSNLPVYARNVSKSNEVESRTSKLDKGESYEKSPPRDLSKIKKGAYKNISSSVSYKSNDGGSLESSLESGFKSTKKKSPSQSLSKGQSETSKVDKGKTCNEVVSSSTGGTSQFDEPYPQVKCKEYKKFKFSCPPPNTPLFPPSSDDSGLQTQPTKLQIDLKTKTNISPILKSKEYQEPDLRVFQIRFEHPDQSDSPRKVSASTTATANETESHLTEEDCDVHRNEFKPSHPNRYGPDSFRTNPIKQMTALSIKHPRRKYGAAEDRAFEWRGGRFGAFAISSALLSKPSSTAALRHFKHDDSRCAGSKVVKKKRRKRARREVSLSVVREKSDNCKDVDEKDGVKPDKNLSKKLFLDPRGDSKKTTEEKPKEAQKDDPCEKPKEEAKGSKDGHHQIPKGAPKDENFCAKVYADLKEKASKEAARRKPVDETKFYDSPTIDRKACTEEKLKESLPPTPKVETKPHKKENFCEKIYSDLKEKAKKEAARRKPIEVSPKTPTSASKSKDDPCKKPKEDPSKKLEGKSNDSKGDPCLKPKGDPCSKRKDDSVSKGDSKSKGDPCGKPKDDPCSKPKADASSKPKDDCSKPKDDCLKPKDDTCSKQKGDASLKPKDDKPCSKPKDTCSKPKEDSHKSKAKDPCSEVCSKPKEAKDDCHKPKEEKPVDPCSKVCSKPKEDSAKKPTGDCGKLKKDPCGKSSDPSLKPQESTCSKPKEDCSKPKDPCSKPKEDPCSKPKEDSCSKPKGDSCPKLWDDPCSKRKSESCSKPKDDSCSKPKDTCSQVCSKPKDDCSKPKEEPCGGDAAKDKDFCAKLCAGMKGGKSKDESTCHKPKEESCDQKSEDFCVKLCAKLTQSGSKDSCSKPKDDCSKPKDDCSKPKDICAKPKDDCSKPKDDCSKPKDVCSKPKDDCSKPKDDCSKPKDTCAEVCSKPKDDCKKPKDDCKKPKDVCSKPKDVCSKPKDDCSKPKDICSKPKDVCSKPKDDCSKPKDDCSKPKDTCAEVCAKPKDDCKKPKDVCSKPKDVCSKPKDDCSKPKDDCSKPKDICSKPKDDCSKPKDVCSKPKDDCSKPKDDCSKPKDICFKPKDDCSKSKDDCSKPKDVCSKPKEDCSKPKDVCSKPKDDCSKPKDVCSKPKDDCLKPKDDCSKPKDICSKPKDDCSKPKDDCSKPKDVCSKPKDDCSKPKDPCKKSSDPCLKQKPCSKPQDDCSKPKDVCSKPKDDCTKPKESKDPCGKLKKDACKVPKQDPCSKPKDEGKKECKKLSASDIVAKMVKDEKPCEKPKDPCEKPKVCDALPREDPCKSRLDDPCKRFDRTLKGEEPCGPPIADPGKGVSNIYAGTPVGKVAPTPPEPKKPPPCEAPPSASKPSPSKYDPKKKTEEETKAEAALKKAKDRKFCPPTSGKFDPDLAPKKPPPAPTPSVSKTPTTPKAPPKSPAPSKKSEKTKATKGFDLIKKAESFTKSLTSHKKKKPTSPTPSSKVDTKELAKKTSDTGRKILSVSQSAFNSLIYVLKEIKSVFTCDEKELTEEREKKKREQEKNKKDSPDKGKGKTQMKADSEGSDYWKKIKDQAKKKIDEAAEETKSRVKKEIQKNIDDAKTEINKKIKEETENINDRRKDLDESRLKVKKTIKEQEKNVESFPKRIEKDKIGPITDEVVKEFDKKKSTIEEEVNKKINDAKKKIEDLEEDIKKKYETSSKTKNDLLEEAKRKLEETKELVRKEGPRKAEEAKRKLEEVKKMLEGGKMLELEAPNVKEKLDELNQSYQQKSLKYIEESKRKLDEVRTQAKSDVAKSKLQEIETRLNSEAKKSVQEVNKRLGEINETITKEGSKKLEAAKRHLEELKRSVEKEGPKYLIEAKEKLEEIRKIVETKGPEKLDEAKRKLAEVKSMVEKEGPKQIEEMKKKIEEIKNVLEKEGSKMAEEMKKTIEEVRKLIEKQAPRYVDEAQRKLKEITSRIDKDEIKKNLKEVMKKLDSETSIKTAPKQVHNAKDKLEEIKQLVEKEGPKEVKETKRKTEEVRTLIEREFPDKIAEAKRHLGEFSSLLESEGVKRPKELAKKLEDVRRLLDNEGKHDELKHQMKMDPGDVHIEDRDAQKKMEHGTLPETKCKVIGETKKMVYQDTGTLSPTEKNNRKKIEENRKKLQEESKRRFQEEKGKFQMAKKELEHKMKVLEENSKRKEFPKPGGGGDDGKKKKYSTWVRDRDPDLSRSLPNVNVGPSEELDE